MNDSNRHKKELDEKGFFITKAMFSNEEINSLISLVKASNKKYAVRQLVNKKPEIIEILFKNENFKKLYSSVCNSDFFLSKAIFFNKSDTSNWFVSYHQDLSISVKEKMEIDGYYSWTNKENQYGVIPPLKILQNIITFRIHLDKTDITNGALKIVSGSHKNGQIRIDKEFNKLNFSQEQEITCNVDKGGIMLMKPLLLHSSQKSISKKNRRVIHLEFCNQDIPMKWLEKKNVS